MFYGVLCSKFISLAMIWGREQLWAKSILDFCILFALVHWAVLSLCFASCFLGALILLQGKYEAIGAKFNSSFHWSFPAVQKLHGKQGAGESTNSLVVSLVEAASPDSLLVEKESRTGKARNLWGSLKGSPEAMGIFLQRNIFFPNSLDLSFCSCKTAIL